MNFNAQWIAKRFVGLTLGISNVLAIGGSILLARSAVFDTAMAGIILWLQTPLKVNLIGFIKAFFAFLSFMVTGFIFVLDCVLRFVSQGLIPSLHPGLVHATISRLLNFITPPDWASIAVIEPGRLIPFARELVVALQNSDVIAAIVLAVIATALATGASVFVLTLDLPKATSQWFNQRKVYTADKRAKDLQKMLSEIDFTTIEDGEEKYRMMALLRHLQLNSSYVDIILNRWQSNSTPLSYLFA